MRKDSIYYRQVQLLVRVLPLLFIPECLTPMFRTFDPHVDKYGINAGLR